MEYCDFLETFGDIDRTQLFDKTWVQSTHWLEVTSRPVASAWQFGDVSCEFLYCWGVALDWLKRLVVTFSLPEPSETILVLSQSDTRFYHDVRSAAEWSMDFKLFKVGQKELIGSSAYSTGLSRSVTLTINLPAGDYVVHVSFESS